MYRPCVKNILYVPIKYSLCIYTYYTRTTVQVFVYVSIYRDNVCAILYTTWLQVLIQYLICRILPIWKAVLSC